ncbi:alpha-lytic protease prodomain-containing protein [Nonomuraea sp. NPDC048916]|uniref:alpha-lytic protease prodomain-containing protein n=1 Tax=Nonomuraea sp. NPDC048916 TaxID=3154232 RepID=UPI003405E4F8
MTLAGQHHALAAWQHPRQGVDRAPEQAKAGAALWYVDVTTNSVVIQASVG